MGSEGEEQLHALIRAYASAIRACMKLRREELTATPSGTVEASPPQQVGTAEPATPAASTSTKHQPHGDGMATAVAAAEAMGSRPKASPVVSAQSAGSNPAIPAAQALHEAASLTAQQQALLEVLLARDRIQAVIGRNRDDPSRGQDFPTGADGSELIHLDDQLRQWAASVAPWLGPSQWRRSLPPDPQAWWWFLFDPADEPPVRLPWLWRACTVTSLTVSLALIGEMVPRFLGGGPDAFSALVVSTQSILTLLVARGALTQAGQQALRQLLQARRTPQRYWPILGAGGALTLMVALFALRLSLPQLATAFQTQPGIARYREGDWSRAEAHFQRALRLNPDDALAHFQLGKLKEDLQQPNAARTHYLLAIQGGITAAANNLARLSILEGTPSAAVPMLLKALDTVEQDHALSEQERTVASHSLRKNLGWARLMQGHPVAAQEQLELAMVLEGETPSLFPPAARASTQCLMAQVLESRKRVEEALPYWRECNANAVITIPEQDGWAMRARERLSQTVEAGSGDS